MPKHFPGEHVKILEWFDKSRHEFKYDYHAIDYATHNGHIQILDWFIKSNYIFQYKYAKRWAKKDPDTKEWFEKNINNNNSRRIK